MEVFFFFNKEKSGGTPEIFHFRVFYFFLYVFILIFYWKLFVSVKKSTFSVEIIFVLSLSLSSFSLSSCWSCRDAISRYIHTKRNKKKTLWCCLFCLFFLLFFFCFYGPPNSFDARLRFFFSFFPKKLFSKVAPSAIISKQQRCHHQFLIGVSCSLTKRDRVFCWHVNLIQTEKKNIEACINHSFCSLPFQRNVSSVRKYSI